MDSVVIEKPYRFIPPHRGNLWPSVIQWFRLYDRHLRRKEGVVNYEIRNEQVFAQRLRAGDGILLAPNHCRYADPLVIGWLARRVGTHVFAMASWHLFNGSAFESFAIQKMGGFSIWREGMDRQSIETAVQVLVDAKRPLILFPEGSANMTNDYLHPFLEGLSFIARTAARRRDKEHGKRVVVLPVAIKYVFQGELRPWAEASLADLERRFTWRPHPHSTIRQRIHRLAEAFLALKEVECFGTARVGDLAQRQQALIQHLVDGIETRATGSVATSPVVPRIKSLRARLVPLLLNPSTSLDDKDRLRAELYHLELAQSLATYPASYLTDPPVTDTRVIETLEYLEETIVGKSRWPGPLKAIIDVGEPIPVPTDRSPRGDDDPVMQQLRQQLTEKLARLQHETALANID